MIHVKIGVSKLRSFQTAQTRGGRYERGWRRNGANRVRLCGFSELEGRAGILLPETDHLSPSFFVSSNREDVNKKRCKRVIAGGVDGGADSETLIASAASKNKKRPWRNWQTR